MEYTKLGNTDIKISKLCLGCMGFGKRDEMYKWAIELDDTKTIIKHALDLGINFFDTANQYSNGYSEKYLGQALKDLGVKREDVIISSKVYFNEGGLSKEAINREIEGSLQRLGTDYLDLYIMHRFDYNVPIEETLEALDNLVKQGKVRALGASSMLAYQFYNYQMLAKDKGYARLETMENHYNLLYREEEREMIPLCKQMNVTLMPYSPLAAGHLSRKEWKSDSLRSTTDDVAGRRYDKTEEADKLIVQRVSEIADKYNTKMSTIAIAWELAKGIDSPIVGASKPEYLDDAVNAFNINLTSEDIKYLEELYVPHELKGPIVK